MKKSINKNKFCEFIIIIVFSAFYFLRTINLDQDLPPWGVAYYQPVDEGAYSMLALNEKAYGTISPGVMTDTGNQYESYTALHLRTNIIGNIFSVIGFKIFGNNYWGLRMPYVFIGYINIIILLLILKKIAQIYGATEKQTVLFSTIILGLFLIDFMYMMNSRVAETSAIRLLMLLGIYLSYIGIKNEKWKWRVLGGLATASIFLVYITDAFIVLACLLILAIDFITSDKKKACKNFINFLFGCFILYIICEIYYIFVWHTSGLLNMLKSIREFSTAAGYEVTGVTTGISIKRLLRQVLTFFSSNVILYNLPVLVAAFFTAPFVLYDAVKKKDKNLIFIFTIFISFLLQTMVVEDCIARKFIIVYPLFFVYFFIVFLRRNVYTELFDAAKQNHIKKAVVLVYSALILVFAVLVVHYRLFGIGDRTNLDFSRLDKLFILTIDLLPTVIFGALFIYDVCYKHIVKQRMLLTGMFVCMIATNSFLVAKYLVVNPSFQERDSMIKMSETVDGKYVVGAYQIGYTLYNNMLPVVATPENIRKIMEKDKDVLLIDYESDSAGMRQYFDEYIFKDSIYTTMPLKIIKRNFQAYGEKRNMCIYEVGLKKDVYHKFRNNKKTRNYYPDIYSQMIGDVNNEIYVNIYGDIYGDINENIYGDIHGNIYGNIYGDIYGDIYGNIYGKIYGNKYGNIIED